MTMFDPIDGGEDVAQVSARPQRALWRARRPLMGLATVALAMLTVGGCAAAARPAIRPTAPSRPQPTLAAKPKPGQNLCAPRLPWDTIRQQTAREMHLTVAQMRVAILHGTPIQAVAAAHHIALSRLHAIELHALQIGNERWIRLRCNTRQEGEAYMRIYRRMTPAQLNQEFTTLFVGS